VKTESLEEENWRELVEKRLKNLEAQESPKRRPVGSENRGLVMDILMLYLVLSLVNLFGSVSLSFILIELYPVFVFSAVFNLVTGLIGVALSFALFRLAQDTYQHISSYHVNPTPQSTVSKYRPLCSICNQPATHKRDGKWVCDEHGKPKRLKLNG